MNYWNKIMTALRGGASELGEAVIDNQALRILDQELRDAGEELKSSKESLASIIAHQKVAEEKAEALSLEVSEHEGYAVAALDKGDESLASDIAEKIVALEAKLTTERESALSYKSHADDLRKAIDSAERDIARMRQQVDTVKATDSVQRAQATVSERHSGSDSKLRTAMESLDRIKDRQKLRSAQMSAARDLADSGIDKSLDKRMEDAGITSKNSASAVLQRLKKRDAS